MALSGKELLGLIRRHKYSESQTYFHRHDTGMTFTAYCDCGYGYTDLDNGLDKHLAEVIAKKLEEST